jgi:hypothetical protein
MTTVNISITNDQADFINQISAKYKFGNRSELFRSLLRLVQYQPELISRMATFPFQIPSTQSRSNVLKNFKDAGLYSPEFLKDLENGLKDSQYFKKK